MPIHNRSDGRVLTPFFDASAFSLPGAACGRLVFNSTAQTLNAALAGFGLANVPEDLAQPLVAKGRLKRALEDWCATFSPCFTTQADDSPRRPSQCWSTR